MTKFRIQVIITSLLISSLGIFLGGCAQNCAQNNKSLFSQLNGHSIIIESNNKQSMSRWITTDGKTKTNIHNQLSYLESCISKKFDLNLIKGQHLPLQLQNGVQYLDPEKDKNEIKLLSYNGETGVFYVTWKYTADQQKIFDLYRKLEAISYFETIKGRTTDYDEPINLSIEQVRNIIKKKIPEITNDEISMIKYSKKLDFKLYFNAVPDIFSELGLFKNQAKYSFKDDGVLDKNISSKPVLKLKWFNWSLMSLLLKDKITEKLKNGWFDYFYFYIKWHKYADEDSSFIYLVCNKLGQLIPELTFNFYEYFSLAHTELFVGKKVPVDLYFKYPKLKIIWSVKIQVKGYDHILPY